MSKLITNDEAMEMSSTKICLEVGRKHRELVEKTGWSTEDAKNFVASCMSLGQAAMVKVPLRNEKIIKIKKTES